MPCLCCVSLQHAAITSVEIVTTSTIVHKENDSVDHSHDPSHTHNSLCGGTCQLKIISAPNDDMLEGDFEFNFGKDFR